MLQRLIQWLINIIKPIPIVSTSSNVSQVIDLPIVDLPIQSSNDIWDTDIQIVDKCRHDKVEIKVIIYKSVYDKIDALKNHFHDIEWLGYLIGTKSDNKFIVNDLIIPKQKVTYSTVKVIEANYKNIVGTAHSHHSMGAFLSSIDEEYLVGNHPITMIVSNTNTKTYARVKLPCGDYMIKEINTTINLDNYMSEYIESIKDNIKNDTLFNWRGKWM